MYFLKQIISFFKNWFDERYGKNADVRHLYAWAAENGYFINRFNPLQESTNVMVGIVNYPTFEVEVVDYEAVKKAFIVQIVYDMMSVSSMVTEVNLNQLAFNKSLRLKDNQIIPYTEKTISDNNTANS